MGKNIPAPFDSSMNNILHQLVVKLYDIRAQVGNNLRFNFFLFVIVIFNFDFQNQKIIITTFQSPTIIQTRSTSEYGAALVNFYAAPDRGRACRIVLCDYRRWFISCARVAGPHVISFYTMTFYVRLLSCDVTVNQVILNPI